MDLELHPIRTAPAAGPLPTGIRAYPVTSAALRPGRTHRYGGCFIMDEAQLDRFSRLDGGRTGNPGDHSFIITLEMAGIFNEEAIYHKTVTQGGV